jgi:hypothetical protein
VAGALAGVQLGSASPVAAQWTATSVWVAEYDTNETLLLLGGISVSPGGGPIRPVAGVQAYHLSYPGAVDRVNIVTVRPSAGLAADFTGGSAQARVGYAFRNREGTVVGTLVPDAGEGFVVSGQMDYWGTGGPVGAQAIGSYNFGAESLWARGRLSTRVHSGPAGRQVRLGAETAYMTSPGFDAVQPGGVLEWHSGRGLIVGAGAGVKIIDDADNATYFRAEVVLPLRR